MGDELTTAEFYALRHAATTYREDLVVSLAGLVGLRPAEMARLRPGDLERRARQGETHYLLTVREGEGPKPPTRLAYVPSEVAHDLQKFTNAEGRTPDEELFAVGARRLQMLVSTVASRTESTRLQSVSSRDLRRHFAHRLLNEARVDPTVVRSVGGWKSLESLDPFLSNPTVTDIFDAFGSETPVRTDTRQPTHSQPVPVQGRGHATAAADASDSTAPTAPTTATADTPSRRFEALVDCVESVSEALATVSTQAEVEQAACDALTDCFTAVWVCDESGQPRAQAGTTTRSSASIAAAIAETDALSALSAGTTDAVVHRGAATDTGATTEPLCVVALRAGETVHGLLCVATSTVDDLTRRLLTDVGRRIGRTLTAVERKRLLLADTGVELTFRCPDRASFLVDCATALDSRIEVDGVVPVEAGSLLHFVSVEGASAEDVLAQADAADAVQAARLVRDYGDRSLFEFVVGDGALGPTLVECGGAVRSLVVDGGAARVESVFSAGTDVRAIVETVTETFPDAELLSKREVEEPVDTSARVQRVVHDDLTEKQRSVLRAAFLAGYFEWPRGSTAEDLAGSMGISSPTLHNHLRKAQQKVLTAVFDDTERPVDQ
ncbi:bacterio-opsin activator domain-containing protein [Haloarchaeobius sp. DFWS5]|uniref:bacterio-opsin activator domain-containing protein n=1 Tax=Haloarchaeobius sp. DFWS5 TaxID=3446114 RepID=UPI003EBBF706